MISLLLKKYTKKFDSLKLIEETIERGKDLITQCLPRKHLRISSFDFKSEEGPFRDPYEDDEIDILPPEDDYLDNGEQPNDRNYEENDSIFPPNSES